MLKCRPLLQNYSLILVECVVARAQPEQPNASDEKDTSAWQPLTIVVPDEKDADVGVDAAIVADDDEDNADGLNDDFVDDANLTTVD